jgi:hypothetical protein
VADDGNLGADGIQARLDSQRRETGIVLRPVEALFCDGKDNFSILHDGIGGVGVKHVEAENQHDEPESAESIMLSPRPPIPRPCAWC